MRKHGGSVASVLDHAAQCRRRCAELDSAEEATGRARARLSEAQEAVERHAGALRRRRRAAAPRLARAVEARLAELAMEGATFDVELGERAAGPAGADAVEFRIAPNPGVPAGPVREIASGGELSRVMLALMGAASAGGAPTLVFDEVDAGIGGHTARAVGAALRELAKSRQVLCITHLPQVASLARRHFCIAKDDPADRRRGAAPTRAEVRELAEAEVVGELVRMLGADGGDAAARRHARELRRAA
jgi:DNA repair protein RecN (Recombination protein N)